MPTESLQSILRIKKLTAFEEPATTVLKTAVEKYFFLTRNTISANWETFPHNGNITNLTSEGCGTNCLMQVIYGFDLHHFYVNSW